MQIQSRLVMQFLNTYEIFEFQMLVKCLTEISFRKTFAQPHFVSNYKKYLRNIQGFFYNTIYESFNNHSCISWDVAFPRFSNQHCILVYNNITNSSLIFLCFSSISKDSEFSQKFVNVLFSLKSLNKLHNVKIT